MPESTFTLRVDDGLKEAFTQAAKAADRTGAQIIRDFMREYVQRSREDAAYEAWFRAKVEAGRMDVRQGRIAEAEEVEARAATRRSGLMARLAEAKK